MIDITVGWKRLYRSEGILGSDETIDFAQQLSDGKNLRIYFGPTPPFGKVVFDPLPDFVFVGDTVSPPDQKESSHDLFFEVSICWTVSCSLADATKAYTGDTSALVAHADSEKDLSLNILDSFCGAVGLELNMQLVINPLVSARIAFVFDNPYQTFTSTGALVLPRSPLPTDARRRLIALARRVSHFSSFESVGSAMHWLLKVWQEKDDIARFMYMFIPLEALLPRALPNPDINKSFDELVALIEAGDAAKRKRLKAMVESGRRSVVSIVDRFTLLASTHKQGDWEGDIELFRRFTRIRNELLHRGIKDVFDTTQIKDDSRRMSLLVEKYIRISYLTK